MSYTFSLRLYPGSNDESTNSVKVISFSEYYGISTKVTYSI